MLVWYRHLIIADSLYPPVSCTRPLQCCSVCIVCIVRNEDTPEFSQQKNPSSQGVSNVADSPHLANLTYAKFAGICTLPCHVAGGLPGFVGPFPSTPLDESSL